MHLTEPLNFSEEASLLNKQIFETIYYGAMEASCEIAQNEGPYSTYKGSPVSNGIFQVRFFKHYCSGFEVILLMNELVLH